MQIRLKSLELIGFKTFASRAEFAFAGAITAIVGPNGSGKSNIADAIRWVLGEQSFGLLRAKKTEDMIFAGSEQRSRAGMAQATISFDNSDGWLPIDFSEVAITRRAYRDGQNEYFINAQKVRLKDVSELLAQSGLSERTYTIIGQGLVDATLSLKPEERRRLFEEAAGIGLYRVRREEALKRLDGTKRNLERVEDILAELQPRLRSLEKQAKRFIEYEQVKADLNVLLRDWYGYHWHRAQRDLIDAQDAALKQEANLEKARKTQTEMDHQVSNLRSRIYSQREVVNSLHLQMAEKHKESERNSRDLIILDERIQTLQIQQQATQDEANRLVEEEQLSRERLASVHREFSQIQLDKEDARQHLQNARSRLQEKIAEKNKAERALTEARQNQASLSSRQAQLSARIAERILQNDRQQKLVQETEKIVQQNQKEAAVVEQRLTNSQKRLQEAEASLRSAVSALQAHQSQKSLLEAELKKVSDERANINTSLARLKAQLDVLDQAERNLVGYTAGTRLLLQAVQQSRISGGIGALNTLLVFPSEFEAAFAAVLGEYVDSMVVADQQGLGDALSLLKGQSARGVILPLALISNEVTELPRDWENGIDGVIGVASRFIRSEIGLQPVLSLLLGNVIITKDSMSAQNTITRLKQFGGQWKAVSLQGEVFYSTGQVIAGLDSKPGTLSRSRERREIKAKYDEINSQNQEIEVRYKDITIKINSLLAQENGLRKNYQQASELERLAVTTKNQDELSVEKAKRSMQWNIDQLVRIKEEIQKAGYETVKMQAELAQVEIDLTKARELVRQSANSVAMLGIEDLQNQVNHWSTRVAVAQQAADDIQKRLTERQTSLERLLFSQKQLIQKLSEISGQIKTNLSAKEAADKTEKDIAKEIENLVEIVHPAEESLENLEATQTEQLNIDSESRQALSLAEHHHAQAKILYVRRQEALEGLRKRVEDDFGLVAFKYAETVSGPTPLPLDGMVEQLPAIIEIPSDLEENIKRYRAQLRRIGPINPEAQAEYVQVKERFEFLTSQVSDLKQAEMNLHEVILELDSLMVREFRKTFDQVAKEFRVTFSRLFDGGNARLVLTTPDNLTETGIDIEVRLPGKREQVLALLSGGERSLTAAALVFALLKVSPTPFCLLDEVDAMLDEANVGRFRDLLSELSQITQFVVVTHNRNTVQAADVIYGVTMGNDSASQVISLKLDEVSKVFE